MVERENDRVRYISIHAPRVGSDDTENLLNHLTIAFQSTLPVWGATTKIRKISVIRLFQSTLPVWGATARKLPQQRGQYYFNPRSPCGERLLTL